MKNLNKYIFPIIIFFFFFHFNVYCQSKSSASIEIKIKVVNSLSTSIANDEISKKVISAKNNTLSNRQVMVRYDKRVSNAYSLSDNNNYLAILNQNSEKITSTKIQNTVTIKNLSKQDQLKFVPHISEESEKLFPESSITIIY